MPLWCFVLNIGLTWLKSLQFSGNARLSSGRVVHSVCLCQWHAASQWHCRFQSKGRHGGIGFWALLSYCHSLHVMLRQPKQLVNRQAVVTTHDVRTEPQASSNVSPSWARILCLSHAALLHATHMIEGLVHHICLACEPSKSLS